MGRLSRGALRNAHCPDTDAPPRSPPCVRTNRRAWTRRKPFAACLAGPAMVGRSCPVLDVAPPQGGLPAQPASRLDERPTPAGRTRHLPLCPNLTSSSCSRASARRPGRAVSAERERGRHALRPGDIAGAGNQGGSRILGRAVEQQGGAGLHQVTAEVSLGSPRGRTGEPSTALSVIGEARVRQR